MSYLDFMSSSLKVFDCNFVFLILFFKFYFCFSVIHALLNFSFDRIISFFFSFFFFFQISVTIFVNVDEYPQFMIIF